MKPFVIKKTKRKNHVLIKPLWLEALIDFVLSFISLQPFQRTAKKKVFHLGNWCYFCSFYNGLKWAVHFVREWATKKSWSFFFFFFLDNGQQLSQDSFYTVQPVNQLLPLPPSSHPCLCWRWSTAGCEASVSSLVWDFLPAYLFLSSHWSHFLSRIQPCLSLTCINTPSTPYPYFPPSLSRFYLPPACGDTSDPKLFLPTSRGCHNNMWQD